MLALPAGALGAMEPVVEESKKAEGAEEENGDESEDESYEDDDRLPPGTFRFRYETALSGARVAYVVRQLPGE